MNTRWTLRATLIAAPLILALPAHGQEIWRGVEGGGGGSSGNGTMTVRATVGQGMTGHVSAQTTRAHQGFWIPIFSDRHAAAHEPASPGLSERRLHIAGFPNPCSVETVVTLDMPAEGSVRLTLHAIDGREVAQILNETRPAGTLRIPIDVSGIPSGTYTIVADAAGNRGHTPLIIVR